ncbi:MAG: histone deacetylase [Deltaproteobacteria bacterium]|nr:histone deacetylase [Deltaproteobacteria bacterium]
MGSASRARAPRVGLVARESFRLHLTGPDHPEQPARVGAVLEGLRAAGLLARLVRLPFTAASPDDLHLVHEPAYVELVRLACEQGFEFIGDYETRLCARSFEVASAAAGGVLSACDAVLAGEVDRVFCVVRPPGHHAGRDRAGGFCLFNHATLAAEHLIRRRGFSRVAVVDFDVHHGNGTAEIFEERADVLFVSLHEHPLSLKYPGTGWPGDEGRGAGKGYTVNACVPHGGGESQYRAALARRVLPALERFVPEFLVLSAGFDAHCTEEHAHVNLEAASFGWLTDELVGVARRLCGGRIVSVLEGGYDLRHLGACAAAHVGALLDGPAAPSTPPH